MLKLVHINNIESELLDKENEIIVMDNIEKKNKNIKEVINEGKQF